MEKSFNLMWTEASGTEWESMALACVDFEEAPVGKKWAITGSEVMPWYQTLEFPIDKWPGVYKVTGTLGLVDEGDGA